MNSTMTPEDNMTIQTAVLLAAGRGSRLSPYTDTVPKPLLVHRGRPTLDHILVSLQEAGIEQVVLVTHHLAEQIDAYARRWTSLGSQKVHCVHQAHLFGTADALECVFRARPDLLTHPFLMSATDYLVPRSFYPELLEFHRSNKAAMSVSMKRLDPADSAGRSSIRFTPEGSVAEVVEKPAPGEAPSDIGANLAFVLPPSIQAFVEEVQSSARGEREVQSAINAWLADGQGRCDGLLQAAPAEWTPP